MKSLKLFFFAMAAMPLLSSCMSEGDSYAGFMGINANNRAPVYANTAYAYVSFASFGAWHIEQNSGSDWCKLALMNGKGGSYYSIPAHFELNTTGASRKADFMLRDDANGDDAFASFYFSQYATRGDGSLGNAPLVTSISGDDGSSITLQYDTLCRPTVLIIEKGGKKLSNLSIYYSQRDSTVNVNTGSGTLMGKHNSGYQPSLLVSTTDTVGYYAQKVYSENMVDFNVEEHKRGGEYTVQALRYSTGSFKTKNPDEECVADSMRYIHQYEDGTRYEDLFKLSYSDNSNRCQSVDVNQLLLGVEECNPYQLIALFRDARNSKIISEALSVDGKISVETTLNADKSVNTLTVTAKDGSKIKYTFTYSNTLP